MLRWCLSTVRTAGGHDTSPRPSCFFCPQALRLSRPRSSCTHADPVVPIADLAEGPDTPAFASSCGQLSAPQGASSLSLKSSVHLGHRDHCGGSRPRAIDALRRCLSLGNTTSDCPVIYSTTTLRSLYYRAKSRSQLGMQDSEMLTLLIGLFGTLSVDLPPTFAYKVPLAFHISQTSTRRTHWPFILKVGKFKSEMGMSLNDSDRFWLMRAELAVGRASSPLEPLSSDVCSAVFRARVHYHIIRRHSRHPEVHAYYLETLLAIQDPRLLDLAAHDLSFLLRTHPTCHPWLQRLLYRLVIHHGGLLSTRSQEAILTAIWSRARRGDDKTLDHIPENGLSGIGLDPNDCDLDAISIARSISTALFGHVSSDKIVNVSGHLVSVFRPAHTLPLRWGSLLLFSIFNSFEMLPFSGTHWTGDQAMPQVTSCWQLVFGLATVEKMIQEPSPPSEMQAASTMEFSKTARTLYRQWPSILRSCSIPRNLACAVFTSFLKIAGVLADATLFFDCRDLCRTENNLQCSQKPVSKLFAAHYIAAAARIQGPLPGVVFTALEAFSTDSRQQCQFLSSAVEILAPMDAHLAYKLYAVAQGEGMEPDVAATHLLAMSLAQRRLLHQAVLFLSYGRFSPEERGMLLSKIAQSLRRDPRIHYPPSVYIAIVDELVALYQSHVPPEHFRGHFEQLFVVLSQHGRGRQLLPVVLSIFRRLPGFFRSRFIDRYCRVLIRHRQFSIAGQFLNVVVAAEPKLAQSLRILQGRIAVRAKASRVFKCTPLRRSASLKLSSRLRHCLYVGPLLERSLRELLRSGRVLAAKHIFACAVATVSTTRHTALGNILLHGVSLQPAPRNGRRVRKTLALLENLVQEHGFRPDRTTANILLKVMIGWRSAFDSPRLRGLFDQLVRGGHPAAEYSPLHPPFGTRQTQFSGSSSLSKLPSHVSFEKHARPLFKMFIKAFYSCNDVEAARKVVGILKVEEHKNAVAKEARQRARSRGRIKAAQVNVTTLSSVVP